MSERPMRWTVLATASLLFLALVASMKPAAAGPQSTPNRYDATCGMLQVEQGGETYLIPSPQGCTIPSQDIPIEPQAVPPVPSAISPVNGSTLNTLIPVLRIDAGIAGVAISPQIEFGTDPTFTNVVRKVTYCGSASRRYDQQLEFNLQPNTVYYWHVRSAYGNGCGCNAVEWGPWSGTWSFRTGSNGQLLAPPVLASPPDGTCVYEPGVNLSWQRVAGQVGYRILWRGSGSSSTAWSMVWDSTASSETVWFLQPGQTYTWWVQTRNSYGWSAESTHWTLSVGSGAAPTATRTATQTRTPTPTPTPQPNLQVTPAALYFLAAPGSPPRSQVLTVYNTGGNTLTWSASKGAGWLSLGPATGTASRSAPGYTTISVNTSGLSYGVYTADIIVNSSTQGVLGSPRIIPVRFSYQRSLQRIYLPTIGRP